MTRISIPLLSLSLCILLGTALPVQAQNGTSSAAPRLAQVTPATIKTLEGVAGSDVDGLSLDITRAELEADPLALQGLADWVRSGGVVFLHTDAADLFQYHTAPARLATTAQAGQLFGRARAALPFAGHPLLWGTRQREAGGARDQQTAYSLGVRVVYYIMNPGDSLVLDHPSGVPLLRVTDLAAPTSNQTEYAAAIAPFGLGWAVFTPSLIEQNRGDGAAFVDNLLRLVASSSRARRSSAGAWIGLPGTTLESAGDAVQAGNTNFARIAQDFLAVVTADPATAQAAKGPRLMLTRGELFTASQLIYKASTDQDARPRASALIYIWRARLEIQRNQLDNAAAWLQLAEQLQPEAAELALWEGVVAAGRAEANEMASPDRATLLKSASDYWAQAQGATAILPKARTMPAPRQPPGPAPALGPLGATSYWGPLLNGEFANVGAVIDNRKLKHPAVWPTAESPRGLNAQGALIYPVLDNANRDIATTVPTTSASGGRAEIERSALIAKPLDSPNEGEGHFQPIDDDTTQADADPVSGVSRQTLGAWSAGAGRAAVLMSVEPPVATKLGNEDAAVILRCYADDPTQRLAVPAADFLTRAAATLGARGDDEEILIFPSADTYDGYRRGVGDPDTGVRNPAGGYGDVVGNRILLLSQPTLPVILPPATPGGPPRIIQFGTAVPGVIGRLHAYVLADQLTSGGNPPPDWLLLGLAVLSNIKTVTDLGGAGTDISATTATLGPLVAANGLLSPAQFQGTASQIDQSGIPDAQALSMIAYFYQRYGAGCVIETLQRLGAGQNIDDSLKATTGLNEADFFNAWSGAAFPVTR